MQKREHVFFVKELYDKTDDSKNVHPDHVKFALSKAWNNLLYDTFRKHPRQLDFYAKEYTGETPALNATTNRYELAMPAPILQLPDFGEGVRNITPEQYEGPEFVVTNEIDQELYYDLDVYNVDDVIDYTVRVDKIIFGTNMTAPVAAAGVRVLLIIPFDEFADTDEIPVPSGKDEQFYNLTLQFLGKANLKNIENG